jgi:hypothetical protein
LNGSHHFHFRHCPFITVAPFRWRQVSAMHSARGHFGEENSWRT